MAPHPLLDVARWSARGELVAGVLSGTSADGIDVALAAPVLSEPAPGEAARLVGLDAVAFATEPFPAPLAARVRSVLDGAQPSLGDVAALHRDLGRAFGEAARAVAEREAPGRLALVASHGQTVFHHDGVPALAGVTLQLGDGDAVAEAAGCAVASDFRTRDCAAGGEGAPLVGLVDDVLFRRAPRPLALLNLGGIANWTLLGERGGAAPVAFDTGPAGALLDGLARALLDRPWDAGGAAAARGAADSGLLEELLRHPFLTRRPPKSTGRDTFGADYVGGVLAAGARRGLAAEALLATAVAFVARHSADGLVGTGVQGPLEVAVAGGGVHHTTLLGALKADLAARFDLRGFGTTERFGVPPDAREALAFAALGVRLALGEPSTRPSVTGALPGRILGKWSAAADSYPLR